MSKSKKNKNKEINTNTKILDDYDEPEYYLVDDEADEPEVYDGDFWIFLESLWNGRLNNLD